MKKSIATIAAVLIASIPVQSFAWGPQGHSTIAQVAQNHLTPKARKALKKYIGVPLPAIASDADTYRAFWTLDLGFIPTNPEAARVAFLKEFDFSTPLNISPWSHSITVDEDFVSYRTDNLDGAYINNDAYYVAKLAAELRVHAETMDPHERYKAIALITHFLGDMHCPMHIVYLPKNTVKGHIDVYYEGQETSMHSVWDDEIWSSWDWSFGDMAVMVDDASPRQIREITSGDVYDWAGRSARASWEANIEFKDGDTLPETYAADKRDLLFHQLRDGGYRLAAVFNEIFR